MDIDGRIMGTALENIIDYAESEFNDDVLNALIEEINGIAGTIERINNRINAIEEEKSTFGSISTELEVELQRLKKRLTLQIAIL